MYYYKYKHQNMQYLYVHIEIQQNLMEQKHHRVLHMHSGRLAASPPQARAEQTTKHI